jgi:hypothetical protein
MKLRRQRGFTLIELVTYVSLVSVSLTLLMGFEIATQKAVTSHRDSNNISSQSNDLFKRLRDDISKSYDIKSSNGELSMSQRQRTVVYTHVVNIVNSKRQMLQRIENSIKGSEVPPPQPYPKLTNCAFVVKRVGLRTVVDVTAKFRRRSFNNDAVEFQTFYWTFTSLIGPRK